MNKSIITVIVVAIIALGGYFLFGKNYQSTITQPSAQQPIAQPTVEQTPFATEQVVTFTDTGYSPNTLIIKNGETVVFKNQSSRTMWPASAMHPTHREYPTTGGCLGSTFDACKGFLPNETWSFKFEKTGTWKFHDHLNLGDFGTIIVQ